MFKKFGFRIGLLFTFGLLIYIMRTASSINGTTNNNDQTSQIVNIEVNYETRCPDSARFIVIKLSAALQLFTGYINVTLVPFGKASYSWDSLAQTWSFVCQHGQEECFGNKIHNCMIHYYPNIKDHFGFINCSMAKYSEEVLDIVNECSNSYSLNSTQLIQCANSTLGDDLLKSMGDLTKTYNPSPDWVPWIIVNNEHTQEIQSNAEYDLIGFLCKKLQNVQSFDFCPQ